MPSPSFQPLPLPAGMRSTRAVQALLSLLPSQPEAGWTEALVEAGLQQRGVAVNRVTVYRALDRLAQAGLLLRTVDAQRVTRYWVTPVDTAAPTAHIACKACHQPMALDANAAAVQSALLALQQAVAQSTGVSQSTVDVTVQTQCSSCADDVAQHKSSTL